MMNDEWQRIAANAICTAAEQAGHEWMYAAGEASRPSVLYRPTLSIDGNQWCALYGVNLQDGVGGFGDSPDAAMRNFDKTWAAKLPSNE